MEKGLKVTINSLSTATERAQSNIGFYEHLVIPLYKGIAEIEPKFG